MRLLNCIVAGFLVAGLASASFAEDKKAEQETIETKAEIQRAKFIDFGTEMKLSMASLDKLGERIDNARLSADPIDMALSAKLLQAAEDASGAKASLKAADLMSEAVDLAKVRNSVSELTTLSKLIGGEAGNELEAIAKATAETQQSEDGEVKKDLDGNLVVDNHSHSEVHVYVNGYEVGHVYPHSTRSFHVHGVHHVTARDNMGHQWHRHFDQGHYHYFTWILNPPHEHPHYPH